MSSDIKGRKVCDVGNHPVGNFTVVTIKEPFSGREVNVCQDQHHASQFLHPENPRIHANKKI
jgi:hypothetical protein